MPVSYRKIPLIVNAIFTKEGSVFPTELIIGDESYLIDRIIDSRPHCPRVVRSVAPIEYTIMVEGYEKKIYYEMDSNTWFSVKEIYS